MLKRILVPLDGTAGAEKAIPVAARIARTNGGTIVFVHVVFPPVEFGTYSAGRQIALKPSAFEARLAAANNYLTSITAAYANDLVGIDTTMDVSSGAASPEIFSLARLEKVDLIVMCSHGETGLKRWVFDSIAQEAVRRSPVPVLVLNEHGVLALEPYDAHPLRILVPLDGSALSETVLEPVVQLLTIWTTPQIQGELHLLHVVDLPSAYGRMKSQTHITDSLQEEVRQEAETYMKTLLDRLHAGILAGTKLTITSSVVINADAAGAILKVAEQTEDSENVGGYDLIAMATHGRSGLRHLVTGSVTEHVLGSTKLPLLIVRPHATETKHKETSETTKPEPTKVEVQSWVGLL